MNITTLTAMTNSTEVQDTESGIIRNWFLTFSTLTLMPKSSQELSEMALSLSYFISQSVVGNFQGHCDFLGFYSCRSFGVCLISIALCYTQFRNIWKLQIVRNLILWKAMTTQPGFEHSYFSTATISDSAPRA